MGYPQSLDDYPAGMLVAELERRKKCWINGVCDYCGHAKEQPACRYPERHNLKATPRTGPIEVNEYQAFVASKSGQWGLWTVSC